MSNWRCMDEQVVRQVAKERFGNALYEEITFEDLCKEMDDYDKRKASKIKVKFNLTDWNLKFLNR